jgi:hypothetical protein
MFFLNTIVPWSGNARVGSVIQKGTGKPLSLYGDVTVAVDNGGQKDKRNYRATAPLSPFGCLRIGKRDGYNDGSGICATMLDVDNVFDPNAWAVQVRNKLVHETKTIVNKIDAHGTDMSSEVGAIYNMLRQFMLLSIEGDMPGPKDEYYNDGHVRVNNTNAFGAYIRKEWGLEIDLDDIPSTDTGDMKNYVHWHGMTVHDARVMIAAVSGQKGSPVFPLMADSPALTDSINFHEDIDVINSDAREAWSKKERVLSTLKSFVTKGRLYNQFDVALNLVAQSASHFKAPIAEAIPLCASDVSLELPEFITNRFYMTGALTGPMGNVRPSAQACYTAFMASPNSLWVYSAVMRSAAEFRGCMTHGTDFDVSGTIENYIQDIGVSSGLAEWMIYASSSLAHELYVQPGIPIGVTMPDMDKAIGLEVVGDISTYPVAESVGEGVNRRVRLELPRGVRRTAVHSKLLFALGLLPDSKVGSIKMEADIEVERSEFDDRICSVKGKHLGAYLTMCRAHGWDAVVDTGNGIRVNSWSDNETRFCWTSKEMDRYADTLYHVVSLEPRNEPLSRRRIQPDLPGIYQYRANIKNVGLLYRYERPLMEGRRPPPIIKITAAKKLEVETRTFDIQVKAPKIIGEVSDFGEVPVNTSYLAPAGPVPLVEVPPVDPGDVEQIDEE